MAFIKQKIEKSAPTSATGQPGIQDEFQVRGFELLHWFGEHRSWAVGLVVAIGLGAGIWGISAMIQQRADEAASLAYAKVIDQLEDTSGKSTEDKTKLQKKGLANLLQIANEHSSSKVARLALLQAGYLALELGDTQKAISTFDSFLGRAKGVEGLVPLGLSGKASAYEAAGNYQVALATIEELLKGGFNIQEELFKKKAADLAQKAGKLD